MNITTKLNTASKFPVKKLRIYDRIYIHKDDLLAPVEKLELIFLHAWRDTWVTSLETWNNYYLLPSHAIHKFNYQECQDDRVWQPLSYKYDFHNLNLRPDQLETVTKFVKGPGILSPGILCAKPGFGKTYTSGFFLQHTNVSTLILTHTKLLFNQWYDYFCEHLPHEKIGRIGDGIFDIQDITVAIYLSVYNNIKILKDRFSLVLIDEAHHTPSAIFSTVLNNLSAKTKIGITATPYRTDGGHLLFPDYFGPRIIVAEEIGNSKIPNLKIINTDITFPVRDPKKDWAKALNKLYEKEELKSLIIKEVNNAASNGRCVLILADRVGFLQELHKRIPRSALLIGAVKEQTARDEILNGVGIKYDCILSTKIMDEGISCHRLDTIIATAPISNMYLLKQRIGRIEREHPNKKHPLIIDIRYKGAIVERQQKARDSWYEQQGIITTG